MMTSKSKGGFFFTKQIDSNRFAQRIESRIGMLYYRLMTAKDGHGHRRVAMAYTLLA